MRRNKMKTCYMCRAPATSREHAPPKSFFPLAYRTNLVTVPSCDEHNLENSEDVEYVRNVISGQRSTNAVAAEAFETAKGSFDHSPALFAQTFGEVRKVVVDGEETAAFPLDLLRHRRVMCATAHALYFCDTGKRWDGGFQVFSPSLAHRDNLYDGYPDPADDFRRLLESGTFMPMHVSDHRVFQYGKLDMGDGQLLYKFVFYEAFVVNAWTRPFKPNAYLFLPIYRVNGRTVWMREQN